MSTRLRLTIYDSLQSIRLKPTQLVEDECHQIMGPTSLEWHVSIHPKGSASEPVFKLRTSTRPTLSMTFESLTRGLLLQRRAGPWSFR